MQLKPNTFALTFVLALMTAMGPIAMDIYVPSLPQLAQEFAASPLRVQWTLSAYLIGFGIAQIFYGPLSDKLGRKPLLLAGFTIFLAGSLASMFATSIDMLIVARALQGAGGAGPIIVVRAIVRDLYEGARAGKVMSVMSTIMGIAPIAAPTMGGVLALWFGWRASFVAMFVIVAALSATAALLLPETLKRKQEAPLSLGGIFASFRIIFTSRRWRVYTALSCFGQTGIYTFLAAAPFILHNVYGLTPLQFGFSFSTCSIAFVAGAGTGSRLVGRLGLDRTISIGVACYFVGGIAQALGILVFPKTLAALLIPQMIFFCGVGFVMPHAIAAALTPFPERAGAAASLQGFVQMAFSASIGLAVAAMIGASAWPLVAATLLLALGAGAVLLSSVGIRHRRV